MTTSTRSRAERRRRRLADLGEILMTIGVVLLLFVAYQLWWTNVSAARAAEQAASQVQQSWAGGGKQDSEAWPRPATPKAEQPKVGTTFGLMYIPRLRDKVWGLPLVQGVGPDQLAQGIGHYVGTAMPGEIGNFATAGHRATHGEPLREIDRIEKGDEVVVETATTWFTYELESTKIVNPSDVWVIDPVPGKPEAAPTEALVTLTTCNPRWASTTRWIWWGSLTEALDKSTGKRPAALEED